MRRINKRNLFIASLFTLLTTGLPGLFFNSAYATGIYDNSYHSIDGVYVGVQNYGACGFNNVSESIVDILSNQGNWYNPSDYSSYSDIEEAYNNGSIAVSISREVYGTVSIYTGQVAWSSGGTGTITFNSNGTSVSSSVPGDFGYLNFSTKEAMGLGSSCDYAITKAPLTYGYISYVNPVDINIDQEEGIPYMSNVFAKGWSVTNPEDYEGEEIADGADLDIDSDGLTGTEENSQGTSNFKWDTDGDGLSDRVESEVYNTSYDEMFCKQTSPYTCADPDPLEKDLFVEIDWMNDGTNDYKPTNTQLAYATTGLSEDGYNVHFDTGEYGGGTVLSDYVEYLPLLYDAEPVGFYDFKNGNVSEGIPVHFDPIRQGVWRYLISGYGMTDEEGDPSTISGGTYSGSDNIFVSTGLIASEDGEDIYEYSDPDYAVAGTIVHEIGHSLCMSRTQRYSYQSNSCVHSAVDTFASSEYDSVLNYNRQMFQLNLSNGGGGGSDHNDWGAISSGGVDDFSQWTTSEFYFEPGLSGEEVQAAIQNGTYGKLIKDGKVYDQLNGKMLDTKDSKVYDLDTKGKVIGVSKNPAHWQAILSR